MKSFLASVALLCSFTLSHAQMQTEIPLWPNGAPGALGTSSNDIPTITPFLPATNATGAAMVICPGGGYASLAPHEGRDYALWLNQHGLTCFVLKYRLGSHGYHYPAEFQDVERAIRWVRSHAADYGIDPHRVAIIGSSAGGHLASMALTHFDSGDPGSADPVERESSRPDLGILCYAVITMGPDTHAGSRANLLGPNPSQALVTELSSELQVRKDTPPCFIWCTYEDKAVPMENSLMFAQALRKQGVPFDLHIYQHGRHGIGLADKPPFAHPHPWANDCLYWLKQHNYVSQ
ncbi:MAG TPA: alpha/beta hydrolase [Alphaproteobacteria bacterium]|nr:alpha/beta hydrolase [Alphaproteobacteria bacterium]